VGSKNPDLAGSKAISSQRFFRVESFPLGRKKRKRPALFFWIRRLRRFGGGTSGRLINLELFFQLLNQPRKLLLSFRFDLMPERLFHFSAFLNVAGFKYSAFLRIQAEAGFAKRRFSLPLDGLTSQILSLAHDVALLGTHPYPTLGVAPEVLPGLWRKCHPPLANARA